MSDYFSLLELPRRPWLSAEMVKNHYLARSIEQHPDRLQNAGEQEKTEAARRSAELNAAYNCLREPKDRLRHLLELERGTKPTDLQEIPRELADMFIEIAKLSQQAKQFLAEKAAITSPILLVKWFERGQEWSDRLSERQRQIGERQEKLEERLRDLDVEWTQIGSRGESRAHLLTELEQIYRWLSFFSRWRAQLHEAIVQLSF